MAELSGKVWIKKFPGKNTVGALNSPFRESAQQFIAALLAATVKVRINATLRPPQRAYLMHFSFKIAMGLDPIAVPAMAGVDINWVHNTRTKSAAAAREMVSGYNVVKEPSLTSNHISGMAIDMTLTDFVTKEIKLADESTLKIASFEDLITAGKTYNIFHKVPHDLPHWSVTGL